MTSDALSQAVTDSNQPAPPSLIPGRSARWWALRQLAGTAWEGVFTVGCLVLFAANTSSPDAGAIIALMFANLAIVGSLTVFSAIQADRAKRREYEHGYTSLSGKPYELWQLDDRTGTVRRRPGHRELVPAPDRRRAP